MTDHLPLVDTLDQDIYIHSQVHFGGSFEEMIDYYQKNGVGCRYDFPLKRIKQLQKMESALPSLSTDEVTAAIQKGKQLYRDLRALYSNKDTTPIQKLIADLILTEKSNPMKEIAAIVALKQSAYQPLIDLIHSDTFYQSSNPGYGKTPIHAIKALSLLGDPKCLPFLLEVIGMGEFAVDEAAIEGIKSFKETAKQFLLGKLLSKPYNRDNERAAIVLSSFPSDEEIARACLQVLIDPKAHEEESLTPYLIFPCEALSTEEERIVFEELKKESFISPFIKNEIEIVVKGWKRSN